MAKIKHNELTNQADLHAPKYHGGSHQEGQPDALNVETLATNNASAQNKVLRASGSNALSWSDDCPLDGDITLNKADTKKILFKNSDSSLVDGFDIGVKYNSAGNGYVIPYPRVNFGSGFAPADMFGYTHTFERGISVVNGGTGNNEWLYGASTKYNSELTYTNHVGQFEMDTGVLTGLLPSELCLMEMFIVPQDSILTSFESIFIAQHTETITAQKVSLMNVVPVHNSSGAVGGTCIGYRNIQIAANATFGLANPTTPVGEGADGWDEPANYFCAKGSLIIPTYLTALSSVIHLSPVRKNP